APTETRVRRRPGIGRDVVGRLGAGRGRFLAHQPRHRLDARNGGERRPSTERRAGDASRGQSAVRGPQPAVAVLPQDVAGQRGRDERSEGTNVAGLAGALHPLDAVRERLDPIPSTPTIAPRLPSKYAFVEE